MSQVDEKTAQEELDLEVAPDTEDKVALDLEGADFLNDEDVQEDFEDEEESSLAIGDNDEETEGDEKPKKNKLMLFLILALLLIVAGVAAWWFFMRTPPPPTIEPEIIIVPNEPTETVIPAPSDHIISFEPYWVPLPDGEGGEVFLICKFAIVTDDATLQLEAQNKMVLLRDAVYYYLVNKPYDFLIDHTNVPTIKADLASVFSGYLVSGQIDDMLFEGYIEK